MAGDLDGDGSDEKQPPFRCLEAARYGLAVVVTVLIVAVIVNAIKVLLRPDSLSLTVVGGSVFSHPSTNASVKLNFNLRAENPSGRSRMYLVGITAYLFDENTPAWTSNPVGDSITYHKELDKAVAQGQATDAYMDVLMKASLVNDNLLFIFKTVYDGGTVAGVTLRVDSRLITEVRSGFNTSARPTTYYCPQLLLGGDPNDEAFKNRQDVPCKEVQDRRHNVITHR